MFAFHGFGNHASDFLPLENILGADYTIVSINLFFHGKSTAMEHLVNNGFSTDELKEFMEEFMSFFKAEKYELIGFSLGGRIALKILELFPEKIERLLLLAPDGLIISPFYKFSTLNSVGRTLFKRLKDKPQFILRLAKILRKVRILDDKKYQLSMYHLETAEYRQRVYDVWMIFRKIAPDLEKIRLLVASENIRVLLFFGRFDRIILAKWGEILRKGLEKQVSIRILEAGHQLVRQKNLEEIGGQIKNDAE